MDIFVTANVLVSTMYPLILLDAFKTELTINSSSRLLLLLGPVSGWLHLMITIFEIKRKDLDFDQFANMNFLNW